MYHPSINILDTPRNSETDSSSEFHPGNDISQIQIHQSDSQQMSDSDPIILAERSGHRGLAAAKLGGSDQSHYR